MFTWLLERMTGLSQTRSTPARKPTVGFQPQLESLEGRIVPAFSAPGGIVSSQTVALIVGDINGDGHPDLISAGNNGTQIAVRLSNGDGTFGAAATQSGGWSVLGAATALAIGTYKGQPSIFVARYAAGNGTGGNSNLSVLQLKTNGLLSDVGDRPFTPGAAGPISSLAVADLYGDGETDLVAAPANGAHLYVERISSAGSFGAPITYQIAGTGVVASRIQLAVGDLNGDSKPDMVVNNPQQSSVGVLLNTGTGTLGLVRNYAIGAQASAMAIGDMNGDGKPDIVAANSNGTVSVLAGQGNGTFGPARNFGQAQPITTLPPVSLALGDFNHDGRLDIVTQFYMFQNNGNGSFTSLKRSDSGTSVVAADFNDDGYADLAEIASIYGIDVLMNDAKW